jgi:hypothetical protein
MKDTSPLQSTQTFGKIIGALAALGIAAGIGLAEFRLAADDGPRSLPTDASARRAPCIQAPMPSTSAPASRGDFDPTLERIDGANDHHG